MKREVGYYWFQYLGTWIISKWASYKWHDWGTSQEWDDKDFEKINEERILPPK